MRCLRSKKVCGNIKNKKTVKKNSPQSGGFFFDMNVPRRLTAELSLAGGAWAGGGFPPLTGQAVNVPRRRGIKGVEKDDHLFADFYTNIFFRISLHWLVTWPDTFCSSNYLVFP